MQEILNSLDEDGIDYDEERANSIKKQQRTSDWSDETLDRFEAFESTLEFEAVATALREIAEDNGS